LLPAFFRAGFLLEAFFLAAFLDAAFVLTAAFFFPGAFFFDDERFEIARFFAGLRAGFFLAMPQVYQMVSRLAATRQQLIFDCAQWSAARRVAPRCSIFNYQNIVTSPSQSHPARIRQSCWSMGSARHICCRVLELGLYVWPAPSEKRLWATARAAAFVLAGFAIWPIFPLVRVRQRQPRQQRPQTGWHVSVLSTSSAHSYKKPFFLFRLQDSAAWKCENRRAAVSCCNTFS
jgi:hypothetical protein